MGSIVRSLPSLLFGSFFSLWFLSFWWAMILGGGGLALHGFVAALFSFWDFLLFFGIPTAGVGLAVGVILSKNPINSLFCLIGVFLNAILLLLSIRVEFLSMIFLIVYIGAIAILFLFVIMLLNLRHLNSPEFTYGPRNLAISVIYAALSIKGFLFLEKGVYVTGYYNLQLFSGTEVTPNSHQMAYLLKYGWNDVLLFTELLYTEHLTLLLLSGMLLLSAMVGSIVLAISTVEEVI